MSDELDAQVVDDAQRVPWVIRVVDVAGLILDPHAGTPAEGLDRPRPGEYLASYDLDAFDGTGAFTSTPNLDEARVFDGFGEAWAAWQGTSTVRPTRADGKPNKPLTALTVELTRLADERMRVSS